MKALEVMSVPYNRNGRKSQSSASPASVQETQRRSASSGVQHTRHQCFNSPRCFKFGDDKPHVFEWEQLSAMMQVFRVEIFLKCICQAHFIAMSRSPSSLVNLFSHSFVIELDVLKLHS